MEIAHRAAILAIGTELTDGQTLNRNAQWISERLTELKYQVCIHETVPDDRVLIRDSLDRLAKLAGTVFVTGGLGPTSDDFTREVLTEWSGRKLVWNEEAWLRIEERLGSFGVPVAASNRQQCYFPEGSEVYANSEGTASGFSFVRGKTALYALPGPPRELEAIWRGHLAGKLGISAPTAQARKLSLWKCIGKSESALGELVEAEMKGSGLEIGYRAHIPYIEVKTWHEEARSREAEPWLAKLQTVLEPWLIARDGDDVADLFLGKVSGRTVRILDHATEGYLAQRVGLAAGAPSSSLTITTAIPGRAGDSSQPLSDLPIIRDGELLFSVEGPDAESRWSAALVQGRESRAETWTLPFKGAALQERRRRYIGELALFQWQRWLDHLER